MEFIYYILLFCVGIIFYLLSTEPSEHDLTNTYQVQYAFMSMVTWVALAFNSFNVTIPGSSSTYNYTFIILSGAFFVLSLINVFVLIFYGTYNMLFGVDSAVPEFRRI